MFYDLYDLWFLKFFVFFPLFLYRVLSQWKYVEGITSFLLSRYYSDFLKSRGMSALPKIQGNGDYSIFCIFFIQQLCSTDSPGVQTIPDWIQHQRVNTEILRISISHRTNYEYKLKKILQKLESETEWSKASYQKQDRFLSLCLTDCSFFEILRNEVKKLSSNIVYSVRCALYLMKLYKYFWLLWLR